MGYFAKTAAFGEVMVGKLAEIRPHLTEIHAWSLLGAEVRTQGRGGLSRVARAGVPPDLR
jgi:hypothetical protein